jgi:hypothetical protein
VRRGLQIAGAAGYFALLLANAPFFAYGPDPSGYLNEARMILAGRTSHPIAPILQYGLDPAMGRIFTPFGFTARPDGTMVTTYPVGTAVHLALAAAVGGWSIAPYLVSPAAAIGCLILIAAVARRVGLPSGWSITAAVILAAVPVFLSHALQPVSDVLAVFWGLLTMWAALRVQDRPWFALLAGVAFAIGVAVRPTNLLIALPLLAILHARIRSIATASMAALPIVAALMWYSQTLYGNPFATGYGPVSDVLVPSVFAKCGWFHFRTLSLVMIPAIAPAGLLVALVRRVPLSQRILLVAWTLTFFMFYALYDVCDSVESSRFMLPAVPALIIGFLHLLRASTPGVPALAVGCVLAILAVQVRNVGRLHVLHANESESVYPETIRWAERILPRDAVLATGLLSGAYFHDTGRVTIRWDQVEPESAAVLRRTFPSGAPWYALISQVEGDAASLAGHIPGQWDAVGTNRDVTLWRLRR